MDRYQIRKQFGRNPDLYAVLIYATQKALKGIGVKHPDHKRQRCTKLRDTSIQAARTLKYMDVPRNLIPPVELYGYDFGSESYRPIRSLNYFA